MNRFKAMKRAVTIQDVARHAGVAKATASYALSGKGQLALETREAVLMAARELGFEPNLNAQRLSSGRCTDTIGLFAVRLDLGVSAQKLQRIQSLLCARGYRVPVFTGGFQLDGQPANDQDTAAFLSDLRRQKPLAIICNAVSLGPASLAELERFQGEGGTLVVYDHPNTLDCDKVVFDRTHNTYLAAKHLLELGHREIGLYMPGDYPAPLPNKPHPRIAGFRQALEEFGATLNPQWLWHGGQYEEGGAILGEKFLALKHRPTALCVVNDAAAVAFCSTLLRAGLRVPEDVSVVAHDDLPIARYFSIQLTAVSNPVEAIAQNAVELLLHRLHNPAAPFSTRVLRGELTPRASTRALNTSRSFALETSS